MAVRYIFSVTPNSTKFILTDNKYLKRWTSEGVPPDYCHERFIYIVIDENLNCNAVKLTHRLYDQIVMINAFQCLNTENLEYIDRDYEPLIELNSSFNVDPELYHNASGHIVMKYSSRPFKDLVDEIKDSPYPYSPFKPPNEWINDEWKYANYND